jgi:deferrochelatase/peroxidase EfeB
MTARPAQAGSHRSSLSWKLDPEIAPDTQGFVVSPFSRLDAAEALFLELGNAASGEWLQPLLPDLQNSDATDELGERDLSMAIAFTWSGLRRMGLSPEALDTFSTAFRDGMHQADRQRRLGDRPGSTVVKNGARWSGNNLAAAGGGPASTPLTVHVVLLLYAQNEAALEAWLAVLEPGLAGQGLTIVHRRRLCLMADEKGMIREHFNFVDGMSQPVLHGDWIRPPSGPAGEQRLRWHGVKAGEVLLGHENAHKELAPGPVVKSSPTADQYLSDHGAPEGFRNLGLHGSYLVVRELYQYVADFWKSMQDAAQALGPGISADWVAERVVGRTQDGILLRPKGTPPVPPDVSENDAGFDELDRHGFGCPLGSHIRRGNPRDSLPSRDGPNEGLLNASNAHRILRRGRTFGPKLKDRMTDDGQERGLLFMCLNSDIARHFEFVQQTWMLNPGFATLVQETDPLMGPEGRFTIPALPIRYCPVVRTFVQFAGGEYFFLPSIPALRYLATLGRP